MRGVAELLAWYARSGRTHLPWRQTRDPYCIVVAEFMLQQTQVERVLPLYRAFVANYPTLAALAVSDGADVVRAWRGLGYNSRALRLRALAKTVVERHAGVMPRAREALLALPGIGPYTAAAVRAFAFDESDAALDTNIRRVVHRVRFGVELPPLAGERELDAVATAAIPPGRGHDWNSAMMDLGATICTARAPKCLLCPLQAQCAAAPVDASRLASLAKLHAKRSAQAALPFEQTTRFLRGRIIDCLRDVSTNDFLSIDDVRDRIAAVVPPDRLGDLSGVIATLVREGIVAQSAAGIALNSA